MIEKPDEFGEAMLSAIYDEVDNRLNPNGDDCWHCGGEGFTFDCFDGACLDAEIGCDDCTRPCPECLIYKADRAKAVREDVVKSGNIDLAIAWIKSVGRWRDGITREQVQQEMDNAKAAMIAAAIDAASAGEG